MNAKSFTFIAIVLSTAFATARAESPTADPYLQTPGTQARAAIVAERDAAIAGGDIAAMTGEDSGAAYLALHHEPGSATRAQVRAELRAARAQGELDALYGEDSGSFFLATHRRAEAHGAKLAQASR
mgnify:CR=1 FL=1